MSSTALVVLDHDRGALDEASLQAIALASALGAGSVHVALIGSDAEAAAAALGIAGVDALWLVDHDSLSDFSPEAWGDATAALARDIGAAVVIAIGTERGNEVLAHVAAGVDCAFISNVATVDSTNPLSLTRVRWGGSLLEHINVDTSVGPMTVLSAAPFSFAAPAAAAACAVQRFTPELRPEAARTRVKDRITLSSGITLQTAPVVVSGGRGVGSADGFAPLEQLADLLGGAVGCSRVVTNQGWRPHSDQVGQTGKRVAPELYIACGISGAIQHWIGMQAAQRVLAINLDADAPMVAKADYAVIGDLHEVIPAIVEELRNRRPS